MENQNAEKKHSAHFNIPAKTLGLIIFLALITGLLVYIALLPQKGLQENPSTQEVSKENEAEEDTILSIEPAEGNTNRNRVYNVNIDTGKNKVTGVQLELSYDPSVLRNVEISSLDFLPESIELLNNIDVNNGRISFALTLPPDENAVSGIGSIAQIKFNVSSQSAFPTFIEFMPKTEVSAQNITSSVLKEAFDAVIDFIIPTVSPIP